MNEFYGKYRGKVENNIDPFQMGRLQVSVPGVLGDGKLAWALPCVPYAGSGVGFFAIPPVGGNVWIEFECGDPDYPIWTGCFWGRNEAPASIETGLHEKVLKIDGITMTMSSVPGKGGFTLEVGPPAVSTSMKLVLNSQGIEINNKNAKIKMSPTSVSVNDGALEVI